MEFEQFLYRSGQKQVVKMTLFGIQLIVKQMGTYIVNVKAENHKNSTGLYNVHLYYVQNNGQMTGVGGTTTTVAHWKEKSDTSIS